MNKPNAVDTRAAELKVWRAKVDALEAAKLAYAHAVRAAEAAKLAMEAAVADERETYARVAGRRLSPLPPPPSSSRMQAAAAAPSTATLTASGARLRR